MQGVKSMGNVVVLVSLFFAGCLGGGDAGPEEASIEVQHSERSEFSAATVVVAQGLRYGDLRVAVDDKMFSLGSTPDFEFRHFGVTGKSRAEDRVEKGDTLLIPAAGVVKISLLHADGRELYAYDAKVPDTTKPGAPANIAPANAARDLSAGSIEWSWTPMKDVSGIRYQLQYGLDPTFSAPLQTIMVEDLYQPGHKPDDASKFASGFTYYWHVRAIDGMGNQGAWSATWSFTVK